MSDDNSRRRPPAPHAKPDRAPGSQPTPRFAAQQRPLPRPPRPMKQVGYADDAPEMRPRTTRYGAQQSAARAPLRHLPDDDEFDPPLGGARNPLAEISAEFERARFIGVRSRSGPVYLPDAPPAESIFTIFLRSPVLVVLFGVVCLVIFLLFSAPSRVVISGYNNNAAAATGGPSGFIDTVLNMLAPASAPPAAPNGEHTVLGPPTITAQGVEAVLRQYNSPAAGTGPIWIALGRQYGIDPAYALAFFIHESSAGTKGVARFTNSIGNIRTTPGYRDYEGYRAYDTWAQGIEDWYKLIKELYVEGWGKRTVAQIIPTYAPSADRNDPPSYIANVTCLVDSWQQK